MQKIHTFEFQYAQSPQKKRRTHEFLFQWLDLKHAQLVLFLSDTNTHITKTH